MATVKPSAADASFKMFAVSDKYKLMAINRTLAELIAVAYGVQSDQVVSPDRWTSSTGYDITAIVSRDQPPPTMDEWKTMLKAFLAERFGLAFHEDKKKLGAYVLSREVGAKELTLSKTQQGELPDVTLIGRGHLKARNAGIADVIRSLECCVLLRPIIDDTHLKGKYDLTLEWNPDSLTSQADNGSSNVQALPDITVALREQLGMVAKHVNAMVPVIIVDAAHVPSSN